MTPIVCASGVELLMDYLEGLLPADVRAAVEEHVAGCPRCVAFLESYRETPRIWRPHSSPSSARSVVAVGSEGCSQSQ
jgi:anti-sigma factor RsiW